MLAVINDPAAAAPAQRGLSEVKLPRVHRRDGKGAAILFADVCRSVRLHELLGDGAARVSIDALLALAEKAVLDHRGWVVKTIGDQILAVMPTADAAARAARDLMVAVDALEPFEGAEAGRAASIKAAMHVGLHSGAFIQHGGDVFGDAVNVASRLTAHAQAGQILTTTVSAAGISPLVRSSMRKLGPLEVRGRVEEIQIEEIAWREAPDDEATFTQLAPTAPVTSNRLLLTLGQRQWAAGPRARHLTIGRDLGSHIAVASNEASRNHGFIEYRNGGFFYTDMSLNGSYVSFGDTGEILVRRSQVMLSGRGVICFGHPAGIAGDQLTFQVE